MLVEKVLEFYKYIENNEFKLKKGYTFLIDGDSFSYYSDDNQSVTFYEFEFNYTIEKSKHFDVEVQLLYHNRVISL
jgi:hypothetical protein